MKCSWPTCRDEATHGDLCFQHFRVYGTKPVKKPDHPIAKKSEKRKEAEKAYKKIVSGMLTDNKQCEIGSPVCTKIAEGLHHLKRRGNNLLDTSLLKRCCNMCNGWIEQNHQQAKFEGWLLSKFS